jgi:hypothetical protein
MGEAGGEGMGNLPAKILHGGAGETSPPAFAAPYLRSLSRTLFVFCFERDPHGLYSLPFQKAKVLRNFLFLITSWVFWFHHLGHIAFKTCS